MRELTMNQTDRVSGGALSFPLSYRLIDDQGGIRGPYVTQAMWFEQFSPAPKPWAPDLTQLFQELGSV